MPYFEFPESETRKKIEGLARQAPFKWVVNPDDPMSNLPIGAIGGVLSKPLKGISQIFKSQPALSAVSKIANLRRAVRRGDPLDLGRYNPPLMKANWEKVQKTLTRMKGGE